MRISDWSSDVCSSDLRCLVELLTCRADGLASQDAGRQQPFLVGQALPLELSALAGHRQAPLARRAALLQLVLLERAFLGDEAFLPQNLGFPLRPSLMCLPLALFSPRCGTIFDAS